MEHGLDFFKQIVNYNILNVLPFSNFIKSHGQLFLFRIKRVSQCDKPVNLRSFVFDEASHEQKSWKLFGRTCNRSLLFFSCQFFVTVLMLVCAIVRFMLSTLCEETTVWVAIL